MTDLLDLIYELEEQFYVAQFERTFPSWTKEQIMAFDIEKNFTEPTRKYLATKYKDTPEWRYSFLLPMRLSFRAKLLLKWRRLQRKFSTSTSNKKPSNGPYR